MKTHLDWKYVPKGEGVRYICCYRNPKDVAVSYYFHHKNFQAIYNSSCATFDQFMEKVCFVFADVLLTF